MASVIKAAYAGTLESSDAYVTVEPAAAGVELKLDSVVEAQFGDSIRASVLELVRQLGIEGAEIRIVDRGALDCVIRARVETALRRGTGEIK